MKRGGLMVTCAATCLVVVAACGGGGSGSSSSSGDPTISSVDQLPLATGPMASASASVSKGFAKGATTGLNLLTTTADAFGPSSSMAACETFNIAKEAIQSASQADMILCFIKQMSSAFGSQVGVDVYDGNWHVFNLPDMGVEGAPDKVKMRIVKNGAGSITSFTMFMCRQSGGSLVQSEYTNQEISFPNMTMAAKGNFQGGQWSGSHEVGVAGTLNADGKYTQKVITTRGKGQSSDGKNGGQQEGTWTQTPGHFVASGYRSGIHEGGTGQEAGYAAGEMLGDTGATIAGLALGDGAVKVDVVYTSPEWGDYDPAPFLEAWLGDGASIVNPASSSAFYAEANAGTIPTVQSFQSAPITIAFSAAESWDCSDAGIDLPAPPDVSVKAGPADACSQYGMGGNWINCHEQIPPPQQP